jgi:hypothetical protein
MSTKADATYEAVCQHLDVSGHNVLFDKEAADYAPGLPSKSDMGHAEKLRVGQLLDYVVQRHQAERAGLHHDIRFGNPEMGLLSWASRKGAPEPGQKHLAVQQPVHRHGYKDFEGEIPEGYGKGTVKKHTEGQVLITKVTPESIHFTTAHQRHPERFTLARPKGWGDKNWLMMNTTPRDEVPYEKVRYKKIPADQVEPHLKNMQQGDTAEAKVDGASQLVQLAKGHAEMLSFRTSKTTGRPIFHTERFFGGRPDIKVPKHLEGSILKGEMYAAHDGKAGTPQDVGTLLNSSIAHSLQLQKERGLQLRNMLYDVQQYGKKPIDPSVTPRADRRKMLEEILTHLPQDKFHASEEAHGPEEATKLWDTVRSGQHPLTEEGIVMHPRVGVPSKAKLVEEHDVHLTGTFPGEGKRQATVGGFTYGHEPGKTVGKVGTGFSDDFLKEVARDPGAYTGRVARLRAQQKLPSGALRAPSFIGLHEDINKVAGAGWFGSFWDPAPGIPEEPVDPGTASYLDTDIRRRRRPVQPIPPPTWTDTMRDALWGRPNAIVPEILKTIEEQEEKTAAGGDDWTGGLGKWVGDKSKSLTSGLGKWFGSEPAAKLPEVKAPLGTPPAPPAAPAVPEIPPNPFALERPVRPATPNYPSPTGVAVKQLSAPSLPALPTGRAGPAMSQIQRTLAANRPAADRLADSLHGVDLRADLVAASRKAGYPADPAAAPASTVKLLGEMYPHRLPSTRFENRSSGKAQYEPWTGQTLLSDPLPQPGPWYKPKFSPIIPWLEQQAVNSVASNRVGLTRHETEHALQNMYLPPVIAPPGAKPGDASYDALVRQVTDRSNAMEIPASLGDLPYTAQAHKLETGKPLNAPVEVAPGITHDADWMARQAEQHGMFKGRTTTELLATPAGQAYLKRLLAAHAVPQPSLSDRLRNWFSMEKQNAAHPVLADLKRAKAESDRGNYRAKHQILSKLLDEHPGAFVQDSTSGSMIGLTHPATGFKIHAPAQVVRGRAMLAPIYHGSATAVRVKAARSADESEVRRLIKAIPKADLYGAWYNAIENKARVSMGDWSETGGHLVHRALSSVLGEDNVEVEAEIGPPWDEKRNALAAGWVKLAKADNVSTLPDGRVLDIGKLIDKSKGRRVERIPIDDVPKPSRSEASGYSKARQAKVDMSKPVIVGTDGTLYDGRHRLFRHIDEGETHIRAVRVSDADIDDVTICDDCKSQGDKIDKNRIEMLPAKAAMAKLADLLPWVHLQPQQERVAKKVREGQNLLVYHGLGSGKSLAGIAAAEGVGGPYTAVVPASLRPNYQGEIAKFTNRTTPSEVLSYTGVGMGRQPEQDPDTIIMDEVQRLRNPESAGSQAAMDLAMRAKHKVLLSGTPIVNQPSDLAVPLSILTGDRMSPATFTNKFVGTKTVDPGWMGWLQGVKPAKVPTIKDEQGLEKLLENHVDYQPSRTPEGVKTRDERVEVDLSPEQQDFYKLMWGKLPWMTRWKLSNDYPLTGPELSHLSAFMTGPRQAALSLYPYHSSKDPMHAFQTSAKLQSAMGSLKKTLGKDPRAKALVYSNFIDAGLTPYSAALKAEGIPFGQFHGTMTEEDRKQALSDYNSGKLRVLLLGPAAAEGISAKGTQLIQLLDPHWNEARLGQARGRGLRFDSHEGLPPELRNVRIQRFVAKMPKPGWLGRLFGDTERPSADEILEHQSERKEELNEQFREVLRRVGSPGYKRPWSLFG